MKYIAMGKQVFLYIFLMVCLSWLKEANAKLPRRNPDFDTKKTATCTETDCSIVP